MHMSTSKGVNLLFWVKILARNLVGDRCAVAYLTKFLLIEERCLKIGGAGLTSRSIFKALIIFARLLALQEDCALPAAACGKPASLTPPQILGVVILNLWPFVKQVAVSYCGFNFIFSKTIPDIYHINWEPCIFFFSELHTYILGLFFC